MTSEIFYWCHRVQVNLEKNQFSYFHSFMVIKRPRNRELLAFGLFVKFSAETPPKENVEEFTDAP